jgi:hypothetical protein
VALQPGEIDKRTGRKVGQRITWLEHPNNPNAKSETVPAE